MVGRLSIAGREVGGGVPCLIIAEAGVNHNGDPKLALEMVGTAAEAGADAVKFQSFRAERLVVAGAAKAAYQEANDPTGEDQQAMLRRLELPDDAMRAVAARCAEKGILFLASPFDETSADFLESLDVAAFKVPSGEITNPGLLRHIAAKGRPMIVSTGMANLAEVQAAVDAVRAAGNAPLALLHCVSAYPAAASDSNLRAMAALERAFRVPVGWSDHTEGIDVALAAVALGACIVEKHFTLDRSLPGPDHLASMEPDQLAALVKGIRAVDSALGDGLKQPTAAEADTARAARKSLVAARDIAAGAVLDDVDAVARRPGTGIAPSRLGEFAGRRLKVAVPAGTLLDPGMFE